MKISKLVFLALGMSFLTLGKNPFPVKLNYVFDNETHLNKMMDIMLSQTKGKPYLAISYDFNGNSKPDAIAVYFLKYVDENLAIFSPYAKNVFVDRNEDGDWDYVWTDKDNNLTLESRNRINHKKYSQKDSSGIQV